MNIFSRIFKRSPTNKGSTEEKESVILETPAGAYAAVLGDEKYVVPQYEKLSYTTIQTLYDKSSLLKKYIRIITDECLRYELKAVPKRGYENNTRAKNRAKEINKVLLSCNSYETFREIREKYIKDLYLYGRAGIEIEPTVNSSFDALYAVPGYSIRLNVDKTGANFVDKDKAYKQVDPKDEAKVVATFPFDSFVYFVLDKMSDRVYGSCPISSIYTELTSDLGAAKNLQSGTNSIKTGVLCLPKAPRRILKDIIDRFLLLVKKNSRIKITAANYDGKFIDLTNLDPKTNMELQKWLTQKANIFNIPPFKLGVETDTGSLNAREQKDDFRALIEGIVRYEIDKLNKVLIQMKLGYDNVEITCPDFADKLSYERARIAVRVVNGGLMTPNEARKKYLGMPSSKDPEADRLQVRRQEGQTEPAAPTPVDKKKELQEEFKRVQELKLIEAKKKLAEKWLDKDNNNTEENKDEGRS